MLLIYTGNGKGKTSACVGQAMRALGQDFRVCFAQFIKEDVRAGEQKLLRHLLGSEFFPGGLGFFLDEKNRSEHRSQAVHTLAWCRDALSRSDMLIMDEVLYALGCELITREELEGIIDEAQKNHVHLVLSGRGLPDWLAARADLISELREIRHPATRGVGATRGIEY